MSLCQQPAGLQGEGNASCLGCLLCMIIFVLEVNACEVFKLCRIWSKVDSLLYIYYEYKHSRGPSQTLRVQEIIGYTLYHIRWCQNMVASDVIKHFFKKCDIDEVMVS